MSTCVQADYTTYTKLNYYDILDKKETLFNIKKALSTYKSKWLKKHKSGGVTNTTFDVAHAILLCIAPTMEDIKKNQPSTLSNFCPGGRLFMFGTRKSIAACIADRKEDFMQNCRPSDRTVYNQIQTLLKAGVLAEKRNYRVTDRKKYNNPLPSDFHPKGHGKFQLIFDEKILVFKKKFKAIFTPANNNYKEKIATKTKISITSNTNPSIIIKQELKTNIDNPQNTDDEVFANANNVSDCSSRKFVNKEERGRIIDNKNKYSARQNDSKEDYFLQQLFELSRTEIYNGAIFSQEEEETAKIALQGRLTAAKAEITAYKGQKIKSFTNSRHYQTRKNQPLSLRLYREKLPNTKNAAFEVLTHAILKQAKNAKQNGYLHKLGKPSALFSSPINFMKAIDYSMSDWRKMNCYYLGRKEKLEQYFAMQSKVDRVYTDILQESYTSIKSAYSKALNQFNNLVNSLKKNTILTESNKSNLVKTFHARVAPLFKHFSKEEKIIIANSLNA
jgi:hypothetical protein